MVCKSYRECKNKDSKYCNLCLLNTGITKLNFFDEYIKKEEKKDKKIRVYKDGVRAEQIICNKFGGKLVVASGAMSNVSKRMCGDVIFPQYNLLVQSKTKSIKGSNHIRIQKKWIDKHWDQAYSVDQIPALVYSFYNKTKFWAIYNFCEDMGFMPNNIIEYDGQSVVFDECMDLDMPFRFKFVSSDMIYGISEFSLFLDYLLDKTIVDKLYYSKSLCQEIKNAELQLKERNGSD
jgi:hypothetical protein